MRYKWARRRRTTRVWDTHPAQWALFEAVQHKEWAGPVDLDLWAEFDHATGWLKHQPRKTFALPAGKAHQALEMLTALSEGVVELSAARRLLETARADVELVERPEAKLRAEAIADQVGEMEGGLQRAFGWFEDLASAMTERLQAEETAARYGDAVAEAATGPLLPEASAIRRISALLTGDPGGASLDPFD